ncbi:hypothetical protein BT63DRAFT_418519 [Microthyrium microscopicum]|uniref:Uncharacterized protein n=1 Tax=Microthyrium microscopicum TaxID=703497 RepID=A0A6A6TVV7_9PEZI|nr:hypothetical protein BT63DRAFT_418519 [Microthyrium microscopicum]
MSDDSDFLNEPDFPSPSHGYAYSRFQEIPVVDHPLDSRARNSQMLDPTAPIMPTIYPAPNGHVKYDRFTNTMHFRGYPESLNLPDAVSFRPGAFLSDTMPNSPALIPTLDPCDFELEPGASDFPRTPVAFSLVDNGTRSEIYGPTGVDPFSPSMPGDRSSVPLLPSLSFLLPTPSVPNPQPQQDIVMSGTSNPPATVQIGSQAAIAQIDARLQVVDSAIAALEDRQIHAFAPTPSPIPYIPADLVVKNTRASMEVTEFPVTQDKNGNWVLLGCRYCNGGNAEVIHNKHHQPDRFEFLKGSYQFSKHMLECHNTARVESGHWFSPQIWSHEDRDWVIQTCSVGYIAPDQIRRIAPRPLTRDRHPLVVELRRLKRERAQLLKKKKDLATGNLGQETSGA